MTFIFIAVVFGIATGVIGRMKGSSFFIWFLIGIALPGVGENPEDLVPVVLAALDRVAKMQEPETFGVFCTTAAWWLMDRLRRLGFKVHWPAWIMSSVPLPGLDRYLPTRPVRLL